MAHGSSDQFFDISHFSFFTATFVALSLRTAVPLWVRKAIKPWVTLVTLAKHRLQKVSRIGQKDGLCAI